MSKTTTSRLVSIRRWAVVATIFLLLSVFATLSLIESSRESVTADEEAYIPAGITYVQTRTIEDNNEHPVLIKYFTGLSDQLFVHSTLPAHWQSLPDEFATGRAILYKTPKNNADKIVFWGRLPILIIAIGLGLLIFIWTQQLFGVAAGLLALGFYTLDPTMIAYSHLVTFDLPMATFIAGCAYCLWRARHNFSYFWYLWGGVSLGLALTAKISALAFVPIVMALLLPLIVSKPAAAHRFRLYFSRLLAVYGAAFVTFWGVYWFVQGQAVWRGAIVLPKAFTYSISRNLRQYQGIKPMYLAGQLTGRGQWWYFPVSFLAKSTLVMLAVVLLGITYVLYKKRKPSFTASLYLVLPIVALGSVGIISQLDIGLRLIFIVYPFVFIIIGYLAATLLSIAKHAKWWLGLAALYYGLTLMTTFPNYLTYANQLFGGPSHGYRYLVDANSDWGQGLIQLKHYTDTHHIKQLPILYFGEANPNYYGFKTLAIAVAPIPQGWQTVIPQQAGWFALSASIADYGGLHSSNYQIRGTYPVAVVANTILLYKLPSLKNT